MALIKKQYKRQRKSRKQQKRLKKRKQQKRKTKKRGKYVRKGGAAAAAAVDQINNDKPLSVVEMFNQMKQDKILPNIKTFNYNYNNLNKQCELVLDHQIERGNQIERGTTYLITYFVHEPAVWEPSGEHTKLTRVIGLYNITEIHKSEKDKVVLSYTGKFTGFSSKEITYYGPNKNIPKYTEPTFVPLNEHKNIEEDNRLDMYIVPPNLELPPNF